MSAAITICVPVYNAADFVAETLDSIAAQSFRDFKVVISLDQSTDESEAVCRRALADPRFELIVQPTRLGWVGNVNALIARVDTPYFCMIPHDDVPDRRYLAEVHALAASDPAIVCAYSDMERLGEDQPCLIQPDIRGPVLTRVLDFLLNHFNAVAFRGVVRRRGPEDRPYLPSKLRGDFAADLVWILPLALRGELRRVPEILYAKRYRPGSVHAGWKNKSRAELTRLWAEHAVACASIALAGAREHQVRELVLLASMMRAAGLGPSRRFPGAPQKSWEVAAATAAFCRAFPDLPPLSEWPRVMAQPGGELLRGAIAYSTLRRATREIPPAEG